MRGPQNRPSHRTGTALAAGRYAVAWTVAVALVAMTAIGLVRVVPGDTSRARAVDPLPLAVQRGSCVLRSDVGRTDSRHLDVMQPPTFGPRAVAAAPGIYAKAPRTSAVVGALRHGVIVVQYRRGTPRRTVLELRRAFALAPFSSIVTPDATGMRYAVAATAWGRLLGCPRASRDALEAVRTFAVSYHGRGPDAPR